MIVDGEPRRLDDYHYYQLRSGGSAIAVLDEDGDELFSVSPSVSEETLLIAVSTFHQGEHRGIATGREVLKGELRQLIGAKAVEP